MAGEHGVCTCPVCCPDKWIANRAAVGVPAPGDGIGVAPAPGGRVWLWIENSAGPNQGLERYLTPERARVIAAALAKTANDAEALEAKRVESVAAALNSSPPEN